MGFFFDDVKEKKQSLASKFGCLVCSRNKIKNTSDKLAPNGASNPDFYILGERRTYGDDVTSEHFSGLKHDILFNALNGISLPGKIRFNSMVRCRTFDKKGVDCVPEPSVIECCLPSIIKDIEETKPKIVIGLGNIPLKQFVNGNSIELWRGRILPVKIGKHTCWYYSTYSPEYLLKYKKAFKNEYDKCFINDIKWIFERARKEYLGRIPEILAPNKDNVEIFIGDTFSDLAILKNKINEIYKPLTFVTIDFETSSLLPNKGELLTMAIGNYESVIAFPLFHPKAWLGLQNKKELLTKFLQDIFTNSNKEFIAHNIKFELEWILNKCGEEAFHTMHVPYDTMSLAAITDERTTKHEPMLSLDTLVKIHFGFDLKSYSNLDRKKMIEYPLEDVLYYNALDVKYTSILFDRLYNAETIYNNNVDILDFTGKTLSITQNMGLNIDYVWLNKLDNKYKTRLNRINLILNSLPEVKQYIRINGSFNPLSPDHLVYIFQEILKLPKLKATKTDKFSVDDEVLVKYAKQNIKLAKYVMRYREYNKLKSTYIDNVRDEDIDGRIHPNFNHLFTQTGRLSSGSE